MEGSNLPLFCTNLLINVVDKIAPLVLFVDDQAKDSFFFFFFMLLPTLVDIFYLFLFKYHVSYVLACVIPMINKGSILGPILYAIFISPLFDLEKLVFYADDGFGLVRNRDRQVLVNLMERKLEIVVNWLSKSGMKVNEAKTDLCLFHYKDAAPIIVKFNGVSMVSSRKINVLGVIFDQKLQWSDHVAHCIQKSRKALTAIRLIKKFFTTKELLQLITSNFNSILVISI